MSESRQEKIRLLVQNARHDSVTADKLELSAVSNITSKFGQGDGRSILYHLQDGEQPHFIFTSKRETPRVEGEEAPLVPQRSKLGKVIHVVTDQRWLTVVGSQDGDDKMTLELDAVEASNYDTESRLSSHIPESLTNNRIILQTEQLYYEIPVSKDYDEDDFVALSGYLRERFDVRPRTASLDPDEGGYTLAGARRDSPTNESIRAVLDDLPPEAFDEADQLVAESDDADDLLRQLSNLLEEYEEERSEETIHETVSDAESVEELRAAVRSPVERQAEEARNSFAAGADQVGKKLQEADPETVGDWARTTGRIVQPIAAAYTGHPYLWTAVSLIGGGVGGTLLEDVEDGPLAELDASELLEHATVIANAGEELDEINGEAVGMLLGASSYFGETLAPEEYAQWITQADPEAIMQGANEGAKFAMSEGGNPTSGRLLGGTVGLFGGYTAESTSRDSKGLQQVLDEDLYRELEKSH
ncbi:hypothetical protein [Halorubellus sp. PRR65]|uniref:hypothetical protein n=1 Tax=Halorubellus sp. PRR65 TaxID=3098148 RepID=UPI002B257453|nr:hypothetical protein [Halorubellus sp. PRR65]